MATPPRLGPRLRAVADRILPGRPFADVGTDHAHLPIAVVHEGQVPSALACDVGEAPLAVARANVRRFALADRIELRRGDGLIALGEDRPATVTVCGMGGYQIGQLLRRGPLDGIERLVLAPNNAWGELRGALAELGFGIVDEEVIEDGERIYLVLAAEPGRGRPIEDATDREIGPWFRERPVAPALQRWARAELHRVERVIAAIPADHADRRARFESRAALLRELMRRAEPGASG